MWKNLYKFKLLNNYLFCRMTRYSSPLRYGLSSSKVGLYPPSYGDPLRYQIQPDTTSHDVPMDYTPSRHDVTCPRFGGSRYGGYRERSRSSIGIEKSITSLHSSGHDSGIADAAVMHSCQCGHSSSRSSGEDSSK